MAEINPTWSITVKRSEPTQFGECCPRQPYVELKVPHDAISVRRVVITTLSHDQGWSDDRNNHGTYNASNTFFEVGAMTPLDHERSPRIRFQSNLHAVADPKQHVNTWDMDSGDSTQRDWLKTIQAGDGIQVIPAVIYQAWVNFVYDIEITAEGERLIQNNDQSAQTTSKTVVVNKANFYKELDLFQNQTRLLHLFPGAFEDPLVCSVNKISLKDPDHEAYEALSYCWGSSADMETIQLREETDDGQGIITWDVAIGANLYSALKHLRPANGPPRRLWADAICIDQSDVDEKTQQVTSMPMIYAQADCVLIWLGPSNEVRARTFAPLKTIHERLQNESTATSWTDEQIEEREKELIQDVVDVGIDYIGRWRQCDFDWFKRTWILQEIWNAKIAFVCCGFDQVRWSAVSVVLRYFSMEKLIMRFVGNGRVPHISAGDVIIPPIFARVLRTVADERQSHKKVGDEGILDVLIKSHGLKATDPRDKVFALLQFGAETSNVANLPEAIRPNYRKPVLQVFSNFVRWWICENKSLRILSAVHTLKYRGWQQMYYGQPPELGSLDYPTWCLWHVGNENTFGSTLGLSQNSPYHASGSTTPDLDLISSEEAHAHPEILRLAGHRLGTVLELGHFPFFDQSVQVKELMEPYIRIFDPACHRTSLAQDQSLAQGVMFDQTRRSFVTRHYMSHHYGFFQKPNFFPCLSRCFFQAQVFGTMRRGICPHYARPGDIVCMLYGGPVLYLIREIDGVATDQPGQRFQFVGECLLEDCMQGRMMDEVQQKGREREIFNLV